jgi:hypothetical protein
MPDVDSARLENCGMIPDIDLSNREPLQELNVGDVFMASDYPVTVTKVTNGSNGVFSGEGWVMLRWILNVRVAVEFENLPINTDKRAIGGEVNFKYNKDWKNVGNLDGSSGNGGIKSDITVDFVIPPNPEFEYNDSTGVLVIYDLSGTPHSIDLPKNSEGKVVFPVTIKDADGNVYEVTEETYIDEDGNEQKKVVITEVEEEDITQTGYLTSDTLSKYFLITNDNINSKIASGKEIYICQNSEPINISFFSKQDSIIKKRTVQWSYLNNNITDSIITVNVNNIGIITVNASIDSVNYFIKLKIYKAPTVDLTVTGFDGSFGFDNYTNQYTPHRNDLGKEDHQISYNDNDIIYAPNISLLQNQPNVRITISFSNYQEMQKDSLLNFIKIYSANGMVKLNGQDTLKISRNQLIANQGTVITTNDASIPYDSIMIKTSYNKTIGKINVFSQPIETKNLLLVHIQSDSTGMSANFATHLPTIRKQLNEKSYNQAFINWNIITDTITYNHIMKDSLLMVYNDSLKSLCQNVNRLNEFFNNLFRMCRQAGISFANVNKVGFILNEQMQTTTDSFEGLAYGFGNWGFAMSSDTYDEKTIVHELGHCLKLHHPFGSLPTDNKNTDEGFQRVSTSVSNTENIMDYDKTRMHTFWLWQWIIINNKIKYYSR